MFHSLDVFDSDDCVISNHLQLAALKDEQHKSYSLDVDDANVTHLEGLSIEHDQFGQIRTATYKTGAQVRCNSAYTIAKSARSSLWLGDRYGNWHPLD